MTSSLETESPFQIKPLARKPFAEYETLSTEELSARGVQLVTVDAAPGYPCRVSLADAEIGEQVFLLTFPFHDTSSPYRATGPIFVRPGVEVAEIPPGEIPDELLAPRDLSLRAYDDTGTLIGASLTPGTEAREALLRLIEESRPQYVHIHNAATGCYFCSAEC